VGGLTVYLKYSLMPLMIYRATELVGGEKAMDEILAGLAQSNNHEQLSLQEFLTACGLTENRLLLCLLLLLWEGFF